MVARTTADSVQSTAVSSQMQDVASELWRRVDAAGVVNLHATDFVMYRLHFNDRHDV